MEESSEEDTVENTITGNKTDPNERIENEKENDTEDSENFQDVTSDESEDELKFADLKDIKTMHMAKKHFERNHMLTVTELKMRKGFYDVVHVCDPDETSIQAEYQGNSERCMICLGQLEQGDEVAVNHACQKPHCLHIECYHQYIENRPIGDRVCAAGPNLLMKLKGCPICLDNYSPVWYEWKYCSIVPRNWKKGKKLPNKDVRVYGIHHYDDGNIKFSHFITDYQLFDSIENYIYDLMMNRHVATNPITNEFNAYNSYEMFMKGTFTCYECKKQMYMWKAVYLGECESGCEYRICRDCFIKCVLTKNQKKKSYRMRGILPCPLCKMCGKARFMLTREPCSHEYRQVLVSYDIEE